MTLEEVIKQRLAEANRIEESKKTVVVKADADEVGKTDEVDTKPKLKKELTKEETTPIVVTDVVVPPIVEVKKTVSEQVSALLETEGLSEEFKQEAVTIFEAAIADKVMLIEAQLKQEFDSQLAEAKAELDNDIDGFLSEAVQQWRQDNEVAIKATFKSQVAESFIDGMRALIAEHNVEIPEDKEDALEVAIAEVDKLNESIVAHDAAMQELQEQVNSLKAEKILESFKEKMTQTEFDRFSQLTESVKFKDESQYEKQLNVVLENFGAKVPVVFAENIIPKSNQETTKVVLTESNSDMNVYANFISKQRI